MHIENFWLSAATHTHNLYGFVGVEFIQVVILWAVCLCLQRGRYNQRTNSEDPLIWCQCYSNNWWHWRPVPEVFRRKWSDGCTTMQENRS